MLTFKEHFHKGWFLSQNPLSLLIHKSNSPSVQVLWDCSNHVISSGSTSYHSFLAISTTSAVTFSTYVLNFQSHSGRLESTYSKLLYMLIFFFTFTKESPKFLMASRIVNTFQKAFYLFCPEFTKGTTIYSIYNFKWIS